MATTTVLVRPALLMALAVTLPAVDSEPTCAAPDTSTDDAVAAPVLTLALVSVAAVLMGPVA